ncbi:MAG: nucleotidyltransferase [Deltaproteobacteria bacterium]|nr:nucleotidyltransferase [Deltaproteobacteria bacterium]
MKIDWGHIDIRELAAIVSEKLNEKGIDAVLVGGACVSIYTKNKYLSSDLDFITHAAIKEVAAAMSGLGFKRKTSRHFIRKDCHFFIEFVAPPAAIGDEPIKNLTKLKTKSGKVVLLTSTDTVKDRLAAYYHWNDPQALEQALMVAKDQKVNIAEIKRWSAKEGHKERCKVFLDRRSL